MNSSLKKEEKPPDPPFTVVKVPLKKVLRHQNMLPIIEDLVLTINDLVIHTYQSLFSIPITLL